MADLHSPPEAMIGKSDGHFSATPEQDAFFRDNCILVIAHDVSDIRAAQARVEASERQLRLVMQATCGGLWDWRIDTGELRCNGRWHDLLGYSADELTRTLQDFTQLLHPDEKDEVQRLLQGSLQHGRPYHHEHRMRQRDSHWMWVDSQLARNLIVRNAGQQPSAAHFLVLVQADLWRRAKETVTPNLPPITKKWPPQPWSDPSPLDAKVLPKSEVVNVFTESLMPQCCRAESNSLSASFRFFQHSVVFFGQVVMQVKPSKPTMHTCRFGSLD